MRYPRQLIHFHSLLTRRGHVNTGQITHVTCAVSNVVFERVRDVHSTCLRPARARHASLRPGFRPAKLMEFGLYWAVQWSRNEFGTVVSSCTAWLGIARHKTASAHNARHWMARQPAAIKLTLGDFWKQPSEKTANRACRLTLRGLSAIHWQSMFQCIKTSGGYRSAKVVDSLTRHYLDERSFDVITALHATCTPAIHINIATYVVQIDPSSHGVSASTGARSASLRIHTPPRRPQYDRRGASTDTYKSHNE